MISCIICLESSHRTYVNLCSICDNFIVCKNCYNTSNVHRINTCPHCRSNLSKRFDYSFKTLTIILDYYKFFIIHILFNIIYSNIFLYYYFPKNYDIPPYFSQNLTHLLIINNITNFIIIPIIYTNYKYYNRMSITYAFVNFIYSIAFFTTSGNSHIQLYYIYYILYFYILTLLPFILFTIHKLITCFNISLNILLHTHFLYIITINNYINNTPNNILNTRL